MNAGWKAIGVKGAWVAADAGELYLRQRFDPKCEEWEFRTEMVTSDVIGLNIYRKLPPAPGMATGVRLPEAVLSFKEPVDEFVSEEVVLKIMLVTGK